MAGISVMLAELVDRFGVVLDENWHDLDTMDLVAFALGDGHQAGLNRRHDAPYEGMYVVADAARTPSELQRQVLESLDLDDQQMFWRLKDKDWGEPRRGIY